MPRLGVILITIITLASCQRDKQHWLKHTNSIVILDAIYAHNGSLYDRNIGTYLPVFYIGKKVDTLGLPVFPVSMWKKDMEIFPYVRDYAYPDSTNIQIFVDTNAATSYTEVTREFHPSYHHGFSPEINIPARVCTAYDAYYVSIFNLSDTLVHMGYANALGHIEIEGLNAAGNWVKVKSQLNYSCVVSVRQLVLKRNEMILAKYPNLKGDTYTRIRLKYQFRKASPPIYSNEFWGNITFQPNAEPQH